MGKWEMVRLGDVLEYEQPTKYIVESTDYNDIYNTPVLTAGQSFILGYTNETENIFNDFPVIIFDDFTTAIKYVDFPFKVKSSAMKILKSTKKASIKYLFYYMTTIKVDTELHKRYWISKYANIIIPLPPLPVQQQIINVLDRANVLIEKRKAQIEKLDLLVKSQFIEMFGELKANKYGWMIKPFGDIFNITSSKRILKSEWKNKGYPFYRVRDMVVLAENSNPNNEYFVSEEFYNALSDSDGIPGEGDIMISATSTIGRCHIVQTGEKFYYKDADVLRFRRKIELSPQYFIHCLRVPYVNEQIDASLGITTVGHFTIINAKKIRLPLPPLQLQNRFADFVRQTDKSKFAMQQSLVKMEQNYKSLMQKCFRGEIF